MVIGRFGKHVGLGERRKLSFETFWMRWMRKK